MALPKMGYNIQLGGGLDTKTDPFQVDMAHMLDLQNIRFTKDKKYIKRNGYGQLTTTPFPGSSSLSTLNDGLVALGPNLQAYSSTDDTWVNKGQLTPLDLTTQNLMVEQYSFLVADAVVLPNGLAAVIGGENDQFASIAIVDTTTGETLYPVTALFPQGSGSNSCILPRVFAVGTNFIYTYINIANQLVYRSQTIASPFTLSAEVVISTDVESYSSLGLIFYDGSVGPNGNLYLAWTAANDTINLAYLDPALVLSGVTNIPDPGPNLAIYADNTNVWVTWIDTTPQANGNNTTIPTTLMAAAFDLTLAPVLAPTLLTTQDGIVRMSIYSLAGLATIVFQTDTVYDSGDIFIPSLFISTINLAAVVTGPTTLMRGVSLASKVFLNPDGDLNVMVAYGSSNDPTDTAEQISINPTYFLLDLNTTNLGKLAQANAQVYTLDNTRSGVMTQVYVYGGTIYIPYMNADNVISVGSHTNTPTGGQVSAGASEVLTYGISIAVITQIQPIKTSEAASALVIPGMLTKFYDGNSLSEMGFNVFPEFIYATVMTGGSMTAQEYMYSVTYEWTDNSGRIYRSAPSIPITVVVPTPGGGQVTINIPTLKLTEKANVRIMIYRWSTAQEEFFLINNLPGEDQAPINDPTVDYVSYQDDASDADIEGNTLLYTTGGVLEDIAPPATIASTVVKNRVWLLDAEDRNLLWFSKTLVEGAPIEFSDLQTVYVSPSTNSQMQGHDILTTLGQMDDKLIIFAEKSIRYIVGNGPDATGANSDYGDPTLISSSIGCENTNSIVIQPNGLMFQSDIGIWLLGRDLSTNYLGAPVELYNNSMVLAATTIADETRCAFIQASGNILIYDYFYNRWSRDTGIASVGSTVYQGLHTLLNAAGQVSQETPGVYTDLGAPTLMTYVTPWVKMMNQMSGSSPLQNLQRVNHFMILGAWYSPSAISVQIAYDFDPTIVQTTPITFNDFVIYNWRIFLDRQKCRSMQITIQEVFTGTPGAAFDFSGLDIVGSGKLTFPKIYSSNSVG